MRVSLSIAALLAASPALAEDFFVRADVAAAVVFASGAETLRQAELSLPAGEHRVLFPGDPWLNLPPLVAASDGVVIGEVEPAPDTRIPDGALDTAAQAAALTAVEAAEDAAAAAQADLQAGAGAVRAAEVQVAYLTALTRGGEGGVGLPDDAQALIAFLTALGTEMARAEAELHAARQAQIARQEEVAARIEALEDARDALDDLQPVGARADLWSVNVRVAEAQEVRFEIRDVARAGWSPGYEVSLDSETGAVRLDRHIRLIADAGLAWQDVAVTLSTADPARGRRPSPVFPSRASIFEPQPLTRGSISADALSESEVSGLMLPAPVEPAMIVEDSAAGPLVAGLSITYDYPNPVTIGPSGQVFLPFGALALEAELTNRAIPRRDMTAYLMAEIENTSGEPILPGEARFFRDGDLIGDGYLEFVARGAEVELPFGPLDQIQLSWADLSRDTGDRGVFASSDTEERRVMVTAENLSGGPVELELLYATPFSEQEDLEVDVTSSLPPTAQAWEDLRGVYAWDLALEAGEEASIAMTFEFSWPDGQVLDWRP